MKQIVLLLVLSALSCSKEGTRTCGRVAQIWPGEVLIRVNDSLLVRYPTERRYKLNDSLCVHVVY